MYKLKEEVFWFFPFKKLQKKVFFSFFRATRSSLSKIVLFFPHFYIEPRKNGKIHLKFRLLSYAAYTHTYIHSFYYIYIHLYNLFGWERNENVCVSPPPSVIFNYIFLCVCVCVQRVSIIPPDGTKVNCVCIFFFFLII